MSDATKGVWSGSLGECEVKDDEVLMWIQTQG